jgi:cell wall assembly regulator SMI1
MGGDMDWNNLAQVRDKWRAVITMSVSTEGNFSASRRNVTFSVTSLYAVGWMVV